MNRYCFGFGLFFVAALEVCASSGALAETRGGIQTIEYKAVERSLADVAKDLSLSGGKPVLLSEAADIKVEQWEAKGSLGQMVADLTSKYGLVFNYDGVRYELTPVRSVATQQVMLGSNTIAEANRLIRLMYPASSPGSFRPIGSTGVAIVSGSSRFVSSVARLLACSERREVEVIAFGRRMTPEQATECKAST